MDQIGESQVSGMMQNDLDIVEFKQERYYNFFE